MGSSKKHKEKDKDKEHKKKRKHRSRSRSKERKRHRHDRDREYSDRERYRRDDGFHENEDYYPRELDEVDSKSSFRESYTDAPETAGGSSGDVSLSIEETNRIRAKLGLKPLEVGNEKKQQHTDDGYLITQEGDVHKPALSITKKKETEKLSERIQKMKDKRKIKDKLGTIKTLGESDEEDDALAWVKKSRQKQKEKELAEKRAKQLMELDEAFGLEDIVKEEFKGNQKEYTSKDLKGLKVEHSVDRFKDGQAIILTLQDKGVLDEEEGDTLINVNIVDDEKAEKNVELKKKKPDYNPYDAGDVDEYGMFKEKNVLEKYDEEIAGAKKEKFQLGSGGKFNTDPEKQMDEIRRQLREQSESLGGVSLNPINEYLTPQELAEAAKFKKVKKKVRKIRKKEALKADDLLPLPNQDLDDTDYGPRKKSRGYIKKEEEEYPDQASHENNGYGQTAPIVIDYAHGHTAVTVKEQPMDVDQPDEEEDLIGPDEDLSKVVIEEDEAEKELHSALSKARKLKQKKEGSSVSKVAEQVLSKVKAEPEEALQDGNIILNATSEFCRTLGDIPTYGQSGNREEDQEELVDFEKELEDRKKQEEDEQVTGWNAVEIDETPVNITGEEQAVLDDEPVVSSGVGAALELAKKKGYIEDEEKKLAGARRSKAKEELEVQNYSIEDKRYDDLDEKYSRKRDRYSGGGGMIQDFKEKDGYKPDVKLEYVDDSGRMLNRKEAFRQLSHRFHGKGSGKKKTEKRSKKQQEEQLMKQMSSTDTPLGTLNMLQEKQRSEKSPYIVLSGSKGFSSNSIIKPSQN